MGPWRASLPRVVVWATLALLLVAMAPAVSRVLSLQAWAIDSREAYWSYQDGSSFPSNQDLANRHPDLRTIPARATSQLQTTSLITLRPGMTGRLALIAPVAEGELRLFVNGALVDHSAPPTDHYLSLPGAESRLWRIPPDLLRPGANRFDLLIGGATGRSLRAELVLGPAARLAPVADAGVTASARTRLAVIVASLAASGLALVAAAARGSARPWIALSAAASAVGARALAGGGVLRELLGDHWPIVDQGLLALTLVCVGCAALETGPPPSPATRRVLVLGPIALAALALVAWFAGPPAGDAPAAAAGAVLLLSTGFLGWASLRRLKTRDDMTGAWRAIDWPAGCLTAFVVATAIAGASGQPWGLWTLGLDAAYGLAVVVLLVGLAIASASTATRTLMRRYEGRVDLGRTIRRQQAEIQAASAALEQEMRRSAILQERQRLARDMHDGIGGQLASLLARVRTRRISLDQMEGELSGGLLELRLLVDSLDTVGETLEEALAMFRSRARTQAEAAGMALIWEQSEDIDIAILDPRWILNLYRLMQEAVTNAVRHSGGDELCVRIVRTGARDLVITVEDNGSGYDPGIVSPGRGLANMTIRAGQLDALLTSGRVTGRSGARVRIALTAPMARLGSML